MLIKALTSFIFYDNDKKMIYISVSVFKATQGRSWTAVKNIWSKMSKYRGMRLGRKSEKLRKVISTSWSLLRWRSCKLISPEFNDVPSIKTKPMHFQILKFKTASVGMCSPIVCSRVSWRYKAKNTYRKRQAYILRQFWWHMFDLI